MSPATVLPRAVLFDWDNTLVDNWGCIHAALNAAQEAMGQVPWTLSETRERVRQSLRDSFPAMFGDRWTEARDVFYAHFEAHHLERLRVLPGAADLIGALSDAGVYLGVVSNKTGRFLRAESAMLGWDRYFGRLVGANDASADKPDPAPVRMALEPAGIAPGPEVWFVGDADIDVRCARASGCRPILLGPPEALEACGTDSPAERHDDCRELLALVSRLRDTISS